MYTKGEWYWDYKDNKAFNLRAKSKHPSGCAVDEHILFIADDFLGENSLNNEADANLIAAAPIGDDLAQAVIDANFDDYDGWLELQKIARKFKAKIEGVSNDTQMPISPAVYKGSEGDERNRRNH